MQFLMTTTHTGYNAVAVRQAVETLQVAVVDPQVGHEVVSLAHHVIKQAQLAAPLVVSQWIDSYLVALSNARGGCDVVAAVQRLAQHFKLPPPEPPLTVWEQGRLFK
jgi:hypothetical protein